MKITPIQTQKPSKTGAKIGAIAGAGVATSYIAINSKDIYKSAAKTGIESLGSKNKGIAIAAGICAGTIALSTMIYSLIGKGIGKLIEIGTQKNNNENFFKEIKNGTFIEEEQNTEVAD